MTRLQEGLERYKKDIDEVRYITEPLCHLAKVGHCEHVTDRDSIDGIIFRYEIRIIAC